MKIKYWLLVLISVGAIFFYFTWYSKKGPSAKSYIPYTLNTNWQFKGKFADRPELGDVLYENKIISVRKNTYVLEQKAVVQGERVVKSLTSYVDKGNEIQLAGLWRIFLEQSFDLELEDPITILKIPIVINDQWEQKVDCSLNGVEGVFESTARVLGEEEISLPGLGKMVCWKIEYVNKTIIEDTPQEIIKRIVWISPYIGIVKLINIDMTDDIAQNHQRPRILETTLYNYRIY